MSIFITVVGEVALLFMILWLMNTVDSDVFRTIARVLLVVYLIGVFIVTLGNRSSENVGDTNLSLFHAFRQMFAPTFRRLKEWGFPRGLAELKWIGYPSLEGVVLNFLMLLPFGYLLPLCFKNMKNGRRILCVSFGLTLLIEISQLVFRRGWFDVDDIFLNTIGALTGWMLYRLIIGRIRKNNRDT